jgi:hypothetical protein
VVLNIILLSIIKIILKIRQIAGHQWLTPIILVIWEAKIRRIVVEGQPRQTVIKIPPPK